MTRDWDRIPLGEVAPAKSLPMPKAGQSVWNLSLEDVESTTGRIVRKQDCLVEQLGSAKCSFGTEHVLYSKLRPYLNKVVLPDSPGVGTSELLPLLPDARLDREFLAFYLRSKQFLDFANANTRGANLPRISMGDLWAHRVPVPRSRGEQRRIVARIKECIERVEELELLRLESIREARSLEFACFHDAVERGVRSQGWEVRELGSVARSFRYGTSEKAHVRPAGVPVLRMGNLQGGHLDLSDLKYIELDTENLSRYRLNRGDVLINRTNSLELVGKAATFNIPQGDWVYASYLVRVEIDKSAALPEFVTAVINSRMGRDYVARTARRAIGMVNLNAKEMAKFPMPVPPLNDQFEIVEKLQATRHIAEELLSLMTDPVLWTLRQSILSKAFAGEL